MNRDFRSCTSSTNGKLLEEVLLHRLTEYRSTPTAAPLPHEVQITEIPLNTIAEQLEAHIQEQNDALQDCAENIHKLHLTNDQTKQDLINLEFEYCLARQQANLRAMTSDDTRLRLQWMRDEIARVNDEKEQALQENLDHIQEIKRLRKTLIDMIDTRYEHEKLKHLHSVHEQNRRDLEQELAEVKRKLDDSQFALKTVQLPIQKLFSKMLVPEKDKVPVKEKLLIPENTENEEVQEKENMGQPVEMPLPRSPYC